MNIFAFNNVYRMSVLIDTEIVSRAKGMATLKFACIL